MTRRLAAAVLGLLAAAGVPGAAPEPITVCMHAPFTGARPLVRDPARLGGAYWAWVNAEQGGVGGRPVRFIAYDDGSYPAGARAAVEKCARNGADLFVAGAGTDQIVSVAKWAERRRVPYLTPTVPESLVEDFRWTSVAAPSDEDMMRALADIVVTGAARPPVVGMIRSANTNTDSGHDAFVRRLAEHGVSLAVDRTAASGWLPYAPVLLDMFLAGVEVINAYVADIDRVVRELPPAYRPTIVSIGPGAAFNDASLFLDVPVVVLHDAPAYDPADPSLPWAHEIERFREVMRRYGGGDADLYELDWWLWLRARQIHRILLALGGNTRPDHVAEVLGGYTETERQAFPSCPLDLTREPPIGSHRWHVLRASGGRWLEAAYCAGPDDAARAGT